MAMATDSTTGFQPWLSAMADRAGMKTNVPVEVEAANRPMIRPRLVTNQRLTMVAASTLVMQPEPMPEITPQVRINCQGAVMNRLAADEAPIIASATITVGRTPKRCMAAAAKGPVRPKRKMPMATARLMVCRDQPKAWPQGTIKTPGADLSPAAASSAVKMMATTARASCRPKNVRLVMSGNLHIWTANAAAVLAWLSGWTKGICPPYFAASTARAVQSQ